MGTTARLFWIVGLVAAVMATAHAGDVYAWDQDTSVWTDNFNDIGSLGVLDKDTGSPRLVVDSRGRVVITYDHDTGFWDERSFIVRHDGTEAAAWNETAAVWTNDLSQGTPIDEWDARMYDSRLVAGQDGVVTMAGLTDSAVGGDLFAVRITDDHVKVWDAATSSWAIGSDKADAINRNTGSYAYLLPRSMAADTNNNAYCAYYESDGSNGRIWLLRINETDVRIWNGGSWSTTLTGGTPLDQGTGGAMACALGSDSSGNIYIMLGYDGGAYLQRYDGTTLEAWDADTDGWTATLGNGDPIDRGTGSVDPQDMAVDGNGHVYVLSEESPAGTNEYYLSRHDGTDVRIWDHDTTAWTAALANGTPVGPQLSDKFHFRKMAANPQGGVFFTYTDSSSEDLYLFRCTGTLVEAWDQGSTNWNSDLGTAALLYTDDDLYDHNLAVDDNGTVYIPYKHSGDGVHLFRHDGTDVRIWDQGTRSWLADLSLGDSLGVSGEWAADPQIVADSPSHVYTLFTSYLSGGSTSLPFLSQCGSVSSVPSVAEISPAEAVLNTQDQPFSYYIDTPAESAFAQVDKFEINVPAGYSDGSVGGVYSNGTAVAYTDNTAGSTLSVTLDTPVPAGSAVVRVDFTADVASVPGSADFTSTIDDTSASVPEACFMGDGDGGGAATNDSWSVLASGLGVAQSAEAEISPVSVVMNTEGQPFSYYIEPVIGPHDSGFDLIEIDVPSVYSEATLAGVFLNGSPAAHADLTEGNTLTARLDSRVSTSGAEIRIDFTADTPTGVDWGRPFFSRIDDVEFPGWVDCAEGDASAATATDTWSVEVSLAEGSFTQNTWLPGQFDPSTTHIYTGEESGLFLGSDEANLVMVHEFPDPEPGALAGSHDRIYDMEVYKDKLYMSTMREPMWSTGACVYQYDGGGALTGSFYSSTKEGLLFLRAIGDYLYAPGPDPASSSIPEIRRFDGTTWDGVFLEGAQTDGEHMIDIASFQDRLYLDIHTFNRYVISFDPDDVSGASSPPTPYEIEFFDNQPDDGYDIYSMIVYHDNLYVAAGGLKTYGYGGQHYVRLIKWDGEDATFLHLDPASAPPDRDRQTKAIALEIFDDELYFSTYDSVYRYDEGAETAEKVAAFPDAWTVHSLKEHNGKLYAAVRVDPLASLHGGVDSHLFFNFAGLDDIENGQVWVSDENGENWTALTTDLAVDVTYALESYRGRLFVGGGYENEKTPVAKYARLFAFPYRDSGTFVSKPVDSGIDGVVYGQILFEGEAPPQTTLKLQLRTATTEGGLAGAAFAGPDGTAGTYYTSSGALIHSSHDGERWFQYGVYMATSDTANQTPMLDSVSITFSDGIKVENRPVSNVTSNSAILNGEVLFVGSPSDTVYLCWGDEDGGTVSTGDWDHVIDMGSGWTPGDTFSNSVAIGGGVYYYRAYMESAADEDWADEVEAFTYSFGLPFTETFETDPAYMAGTLGEVNGQHGWTADAGAEVQDGVSWEFDHAAELDGAALRHEFNDEQTNVWTVFAMKPVAGVLDADNIPADATVVVWVNEGGTLSAYNNQTPVDTGHSVDTSKWVRIQVQSDYIAKEWSLWANGEKLVDQFGFYSDTLSGLSRVNWRAYDASSLYVDDVRIGTDAWNPQPGDTDGDGLADDWEILYFHSPNIIADGSGDLDGDSMTDGDEETAGTNPADPASFLQAAMDATAGSPSHVVISWESATGRVYNVLWTPSMLEPFQPLAAGIQYPQNSYTDTVHAVESAGFYRLVAMRADYDLDGDGLPNDWEGAYGVSDAAADGDFDGFSNLEEFIAGSDPTNGASFFTIASVASASNSVVLCWLSVAGRVYSVDGSSNLVEGAGWFSIEDHIPATPPENVYTTQTHSAEASYNRVRVRKE